MVKKRNTSQMTIPLALICIVMFIVAVSIIIFDSRISMIEDSLDSYEEICNDWETVERYELISENYYICRLTYMSYPYYMGETSERERYDIDSEYYDECVDDFRPYIRYYNESVCMQTILVKK